MREDLLHSSLYLNKVVISKQIPRGNYLAKLPVVANLKKMDGLEFTRPVSFIVGENGVTF